MYFSFCFTCIGVLTQCMPVYHVGAGVCRDQKRSSDPPGTVLCPSGAKKPPLC